MSSSVSSLIQQLNTDKLIGIVRTDTSESALWASRVLIEAGINWIEIPFTVPQATQVMEQLVEQYPQANIGAGTVLEAKEALQALGAGCKFLVAPVVNEPLIQLGLEQDLLVLPGAMTPTEIYKAWSLGASAVKFFPAQATGGVDFISAFRGPFPKIPLVATGGIELEHVPGYLMAGALAVGVGGRLVSKQMVLRRDEQEMRLLAKCYVEAAQNFSKTSAGQLAV